MKALGCLTPGQPAKTGYGQAGLRNEHILPNRPVFHMLLRFWSKPLLKLPEGRHRACACHIPAKTAVPAMPSLAVLPQARGFAWDVGHLQVSAKTVGVAVAVVDGFVEA